MTTRTADPQGSRLLGEDAEHPLLARGPLGGGGVLRVLGPAEPAPQCADLVAGKCCVFREIPSTKITSFDIRGIKGSNSNRCEECSAP